MEVSIRHNYNVENKDREVSIEFSNEDFWNLDITLAYVLKEAIIKYKTQLTGCAMVDESDLPDYLKLENFKQNLDEEEQWQLNILQEKQYIYILDQIIFAFDGIITEFDLVSDLTSEQEDARNQQIQKGLMLFAKYYRSFWN